MASISSANMQIATTILQQLGGNKFKVMTGMKNALAIENGLSFRLPSNFAKAGINVVSIVLMPSDTYRVTFGKIRGHSYKVTSVHEDIYNDMLQPLFTRVTGLDTHL